MRTQFLLKNEPLDLQAVHEFLNEPATGGQVMFVGTVRQTSQKRQVMYLEFEAYEPMALRELDRIANEMKNRWPLHSVLLHHRLGVCPVLEVPVMAAVAAAHRSEAFEACAYLMNRLKQSVPIWKKEVFADGYVWVSATP